MESLDTVQVKRTHLGWFADSMRQAAEKLDEYAEFLITESVSRSLRAKYEDHFAIMDASAKEAASACLLADKLRRYVAALEEVL